MARFNDNNYFARREASEAKQGQKTYNLQQAVAEKFNMRTDWEVANPVESKKRKVDPSYQNITAPTIDPSRPRALKLAYSREAQKLVVKFRDGTWWEYNQIPVEMWNDLKATDSTGRYLKNSGLDTHDDMGPFNPNEMPQETRVIFNS